MCTSDLVSTLIHTFISFQNTYYVSVVTNNNTLATTF